MLAQKLLEQSITKLRSAGIATARLDSLVLLEYLTGKDRAWLLAHPEHTIQGPALASYSELIDRRTKHEPVAYIIGKSEFYGREFLVSPATLQPRPETETMIDLLVSEIASRLGGEKSVVVDVGTGSGCLAITAKLEWPKAKVLATEINADALKIARKNAKKLCAKVNFFEGDLLSPVFSKINIPDTKLVILANLPYVPDNHVINEAAMQEPKIAIFGGPDGLDLYRKLFQQISELSTSPMSEIFVLTESLPFQHKDLEAIANRNNFSLERTQDFINVFNKHRKSK